MVRADFTGKYNIRFAVTYGRPDTSPNAPYPVDASYAATILTPLTALYKEFMRIYTADVQDNILQMSIVGAAKLIELWLGVVILPTFIRIDFNRFPYLNRTLEIPRGPLYLSTAPTLAQMRLRYTIDSNTPLSESLQISIDNDASSVSDVRLQADQTYPKLVLRNGMIWPTPLFIEDFPIRFEAMFGIIDPVFIATASQQDIAIAYNVVLMPFFQLAYHIYQNRSPINEKTVSEMPFTLKAMLRALQQ